MGNNMIDPKLYNEEELIIFDEGLFGFEQNKNFLPLPMEEGNQDIISLLSVDDDNLSFVLMNPFKFMDDYDPILSSDDYQKLGTESEEKLSFHVVCVVADEPSASTLNMKCPIVVNVETRKACQVILQNSTYSMRHSLKELSQRRA